MKETLIKLLLKLLAGISKEQWAQAVQYVTDAAKTAMDSVEKRNWVIDSLKARWPQLSNWATNWLVETSVAYFKNRQ